MDWLSLIFGGHWWPALILVAGAAAVAFVALRFDLRAAVPLGLAVAALFIDQRAAARGERNQKEKELADAEKRAKERERIHEDVARADDDDLRRRAARWARDRGDGAGI